jgi:anti-anti-sigma factor
MSTATASIRSRPLSASLVTQMAAARSALRATIEDNGSAVLLYAGGEIDASNEAIWRRLLGEAATATAAPGPLVIDINGLDFMAGCGYAALAEQADRCRARGIDLALVSAHLIVARVVAAMKLDRQLSIYHDVDAALMANIQIQ